MSKTDSKVALVFGSVLFATWILYAGITLYPPTSAQVSDLTTARGSVVVPSEMLQSLEDALPDVKRQLWITWAINGLLAISGLIASALALRNHSRWKLAVLVSSGCFVLFWWATSLFVESNVSVLDASIATWISGPAALLDRVGVIASIRMIFRDHVLFVVHHFAVMYMSLSVLKK